MKFIICLLFFSINVIAMDIGLEFAIPEVKVGQIVSAKLRIDATSAHEIPLQSLKTKTFSDIIYLHESGTLVRNEGKPYFETEVKVIFLKVPDENKLDFVENGKNIKVFWNKLIVLPTQSDKKFLYGAFEVPKRFKVFSILMYAMVFIFLGILASYIYIIQKRKNILKRKKKELKLKLISGSTYPEIVSIWLERQNYLQTFPLIEPSFRKFETIIFKYQFKPVQSEQERNTVVESYNAFVNEIKGALDGI